MKTIHDLCVVPPSKSGITLECRQQIVRDFEIPNLIKIKVVMVQAGATSVEDEIDDALCVPELLRNAIAAEKEGSSGLLVDCMCDPGVRALRTAVSIPVVGPAEIAFHIAASLCHKFSVIDIGNNTGPMVEDLVYKYGLKQSFASVRNTGIPAEHIRADLTKTYETLVRVAKEAIEKDNADGIVLGCTGFVGCAQYVRKALLKLGYDVPVIDPRPLAIRTLTAIVLEGLTHSKKAWPSPKPASKQLLGFNKDDPLQLLYNQADMD